MFGKLVGDKLTYPPKNLKTDNGQLIVNFNKDEKLMRQYGYKEVVDAIPDYDKTSQYILVANYTEDDNTITINYEVVDIPIPEPTELELLQQQVDENTEAIADTQSAIDFILFGDTGLEGGE